MKFSVELLQGSCVLDVGCTPAPSLPFHYLSNNKYCILEFTETFVNTEGGKTSKPTLNKLIAVFNHNSWKTKFFSSYKINDKNSFFLTVSTQKIHLCPTKNIHATPGLMYGIVRQPVVGLDHDEGL